VNTATIADVGDLFLIVVITSSLLLLP